MVKCGKNIYVNPACIGGDSFEWIIVNNPVNTFEDLLNLSANKDVYNTPSEFWEDWTLEDFEGNEYNLDRLTFNPDTEFS